MFVLFAKKKKIHNFETSDKHFAIKVLNMFVNNFECFVISTCKFMSCKSYLLLENSNYWCSENILQIITPNSQEVDELVSDILTRMPRLLQNSNTY